MPVGVARGVEPPQAPAVVAQAVAAPAVAVDKNEAMAVEEAAVAAASRKRAAGTPAEPESDDVAETIASPCMVTSLCDRGCIIAWLSASSQAPVPVPSERGVLCALVLCRPQE